MLGLLLSGVGNLQAGVGPRWDVWAYNGLIYWGEESNGTMAEGSGWSSEGHFSSVPTWIKLGSYDDQFLRTNGVTFTVPVALGSKGPEKSSYGVVAVPQGTVLIGNPIWLDDLNSANLLPSIQACLFKHDYEGGAASVHVLLGDDCTACACQTCQSEPGGVGSQNNLVDVSISLGLVKAQGESAGAIRIYADAPTSSLGTPSALIYDTRTSGIKISRTNGVLSGIQTQLNDVRVTTLSDRTYKVETFSSTSSNLVSTVTVDNPDGQGQVLEITETRGNNFSAFKYEWQASSREWKLSSGMSGISGGSAGSPLRIATSSSTVLPDGQTKEVQSVSDSTGAEIFRQEKYFVDMNAFGLSNNWRVVKIITDPKGAALQETTSYYGQEAGATNYGRVRQEVDAFGSWRKYEYDSVGRVTKLIEGFLDVSVSDNGDNSRVTTYNYTTNDIAGSPDDGSNPNQARTVIVTLAGQEISRKYVISTPNEFMEIVATAPGAAWNTSSNLVTRTRWYPEEGKSEPSQSIIYPDGTARKQSAVLSPDSTLKTTTVWQGKPGDANAESIISGTRTITVRNPYQSVTFTNLVYDIEQTNVVLSSQINTVDSLKRVTRTDYLDGTYETMTYGCCGLESQTDREGIVTEYLYDDLKRLTTTIRGGIISINTLDAEGRVVKSIRKGSDNSEITTGDSIYDVAGRLIASTDAMGHKTTFSEVISDGHRVQTTTYTDGTTRIESYYRDGSLKCVAGTAVHETRYEYGADSAGTWTKEIRVGIHGSNSEWTKTYTDMAGRTYNTVYPDSAYSLSSYNEKGQLVRQVDPDGVTTLYEYNGLGELETTTSDINRNGIVDFSGPDRITKTVRSVSDRDGTTVQRQTTSVFKDGQSTPTEVAVQDVSADGLKSWSTSYGLTTASATQYLGGGQRRVTVTAPDGTQTVSTYQDGRQTSSQTAAGSVGTISSTTNTFDAHGRLATSTDARGLKTLLAYNNADQVIGQTVEGGGLRQTTAFEFDTRGQRVKTTLPDGGVVQYEYHPTGELRKQSGARTYTSEYTYTPEGRLATLKAGQGTTTWNYTPDRGFLASKKYSDGKGPEYTYTAAGRLASRKWARGITTSYTYSTAGDLIRTEYSDGTPTVVASYDRLGRRNSTSSTRYSYGEAGEVLSESWSGGPLNGLAVTSTYDHLRRRTSAAATSSVGPLASSAFTYDHASRLATVASGVLAAQYSYRTNSSLISAITFSKDANPVLITTKSYDALSRLYNIQTTNSINSFRKAYTYTYNSANQRVQVTLADSTLWKYQYDELGQVTSGKRLYYDEVTEVLGQQFGYAFDDIGNRTSTTVATRPSTYTANALNQYTRRTVPGSVDIMGTAAFGSEVRVNSQPTARQGNYFYARVDVSNAPSPAYLPVSIVGTQYTLDPSGKNAVAESKGHVFFPANPEQFEYDADGNLTLDGRWHYFWDGENRLVSMITRDFLAEGPPLAKLDFTYDSMSRRIEKKTYLFNVPRMAYALQSTHRFLYDGWNLLAEMNENGAVLRSFAWGLDLSGNEQGAGGVGGLLMVANAADATAHFPCFDGNGNVMGLANAADGKLSAEYEYGPFGEAIRQTGSMANLSPFRFSTKYQDDESRLLYYGSRYLNVKTGRWISRDSINKESDPNLYLTLFNSPPNWIDRAGNDNFANTGIMGVQQNVVASAAIGDSTPSTSPQTIDQLSPFFGGYSGYARDSAWFARRFPNSLMDHISKSKAEVEDRIRQEHKRRIRGLQVAVGVERQEIISVHFEELVAWNSHSDYGDANESWLSASSGQGGIGYYTVAINRLKNQTFDLRYRIRKCDVAYHYSYRLVVIDRLGYQWTDIGWWLTNGGGFGMVIENRLVVRASYDIDENLYLKK